MKNRLAILCALLALGLSFVLAKDDEKAGPEITKTKFPGLIVNIRYFDDSNVVTATDIEHNTVHRSTDGGKSWHIVKDIAEGEAQAIIHHPFNNKVAVCLGSRQTHWITTNQGETWTSFKSRGDPNLAIPPLSFHADDPDKIILNTRNCEEIICEDIAIYTTDGFQTEPKELKEGSSMCIWARTQKLFSTGDKKKDADQTLCIVPGRFSLWKTDFRLLTSTDYFNKDEVEPGMENNRPVTGLATIASVKGYIVAAARSEFTAEMSLYVTTDAENWQRARFGDQAVEQDAYTILESTNYSIQVDVMTSLRNLPMGSLFTSNSRGTYFSKNIEHVNRNPRGYVDFEKVQNIQGIVMVNLVDNWKEIGNGVQDGKKIKSRISFDDGRSFHEMKVDKEPLHLHGVTDQHNSGRVYSSPAPGLVMGNGNTGKFLGDRAHAALYVSDDAGFTWRKALNNNHMYEFGDQGSLIVVAADKPDLKRIGYSLNHGKDWEWKNFDGFTIRPLQLTTVPDSTSRKFILYAEEGRGDDAKHVIIHLDFDKLHEKKCKKDDFEKWWARVDKKGDATCIMGHKQWYHRRKADADCFVKDEDFNEPEPEFEDCPCADEDFECDEGFERTDDGEKCEPIEPLTPPADSCENGKGTFMGKSGWRKIPGNTCDLKKGVDKAKEVERPCEDTVKKPASNKITHTTNSFRASTFREFYYLEHKEGHDETVVMRTDRREVFITRDHGKNWDLILEKDKVEAIYPHQYFHETVYFITPSRKVFYSHDRGVNLHSFEAPDVPNLERVEYLRFHPEERDWLIWTGAKNCQYGFGEDCHTIAHVSQKNGDEWKTLLPFVRKCVFATSEIRRDSEQLVYCEQYQDENTDGSLQLVSSKDWFAHKNVTFTDVVEFATMSEYIIVATRDKDEKSLRVDASINGKDFANAQFPLNFQVAHQQAYTVLDSSTHAVFLHVTVNNIKHREYGTILKSNSNGTSYVTSISAVSRNTQGYVDFEKMRGLEGVAIVNVVANVKDTDDGENKQLRTKITHNDGADWTYLTPPEEDSEGKPYEDCKQGDKEGCSLHLHGYTERKDPRRAYSSPSAAGIMIGIGNVGDQLTSRSKGNTFITTDGGVKWREVMKGAFMWEYGDSGSIIVLVAEEEPTNIIYYTLDQGESWQKYKFSDEGEVIVSDISSVPSDMSRNFLLWGKEAGSNGDLVTVNLDFTGLTNKQCELNRENPDAGNSDFDLWQPKHPMQKDDCLFGHVAQYY
ncbi:MAG: hypothetical protein Q9157_002575, partial [Trypethelium eluteriae]